MDALLVQVSTAHSMSLKRLPDAPQCPFRCVCPKNIRILLAKPSRFGSTCWSRHAHLLGHGGWRRDLRWYDPRPAPGLLAGDGGDGLLLVLLPPPGVDDLGQAEEAPVPPPRVA